MKQRRREKSYGLYQPAYLAAQITSVSFAYLATGFAMYPVVLTEEIIATLQEQFELESPIKRDNTVFAYNIPYIYANEELKRYPVAKVSLFSKHSVGVISELSISLVSSLIAGLTAITVGLLQTTLFVGVGLIAGCFIGVGLLIGAIAVLARGLVIGPKAALNEAAELLNNTLAI